jgi:hypothetical protein
VKGKLPSDRALQTHGVNNAMGLKSSALWWLPTSTTSNPTKSNVLWLSGPGLQTVPNQTSMAWSRTSAAVRQTCIKDGPSLQKACGWRVPREASPQLRMLHASSVRESQAFLSQLKNRPDIRLMAESA